MSSIAFLLSAGRSDDKQCRLTLRIDDHTDVASFYQVWKAAAIANNLCVKNGKKAAMVNIGLSLAAIFSSQVIDTDL